MNSLVLINYAPPFTSVYKYTLEISSCVSFPVKIVNLKYTNRTGSWDLPSEGTSFKGYSKNLFALNLMFGRRAFRRAKEFIDQESDNQTILHYTHQNIRPLMEPTNRTVVTVHDNPETNLRFGIYTNRPDTIRERTYFRFWAHMVRVNYEIYSRFQNVVTHSDYVKNSLIRFGFTGKITTIYPAVGEHFTPLTDVTKLRRKLHLPQKKRLVLSVSTTHKRKNLDTVLAVMKVLDDKYQLVRVGKPLGDSINFSNVSSEEINEIYNACDVMLIPSTEEGFGTTIPEALTVGLPVVASDIPVFKEAFGKTILMEDPFDVKSLARAVQDAFEGKESLAAAGKEKAKDYSYDAYKKRINDYYASLLKS